MSATMAEIGPYLALILVGFLPNEVWRVLGLVLVRGLDERSQFIVWVRAVATAMLAGVLAQLILASSGALAAVPLWVRIGAAAVGLLAFFAARRSVFAGVAAGVGAFVLGAYLMGY
ncbi:MAG: AzlD domain-containing protein [Alphaproteobacteria bacterium]|nr:AzlD domain-containing protein [Alphaproteobacteria bacterium]